MWIYLFKKRDDNVKNQSFGPMISHYSSLNNSLALHVYLFFKKRDNNVKNQLFWSIYNSSAITRDKPLQLFK